MLQRRYLTAHPSAEGFVSFKDFSFFRIRPTGTHLVAGFGRIVDLKPAQFLTDLSGAEDLLAAEEGAVAHMNADHRDAMGLYATKLLGAAAGDWRWTRSMILGPRTVTRNPAPWRACTAWSTR